MKNVKSKKYEKIEIKPIDFEGLNVSYMRYDLKKSRVQINQNKTFLKKTIKKFSFENWFLYSLTKKNADNGFKYKRNLSELEYEAMLKNNISQQEDKQIIVFIYENQRWIVERNKQENEKTFIKCTPETKFPYFIHPM